MLEASYLISSLSEIQIVLFLNGNDKNIHLIELWEELNK